MMTPQEKVKALMPGLSMFTTLEKGANAPRWLFEGVCRAWKISLEEAELSLITVSENATFLLRVKSESYGVVRVSQPGYVGGKRAVESELAWLTSLYSVEEVNLVKAIPTMCGSFVADIQDTFGKQWACVMTSFVDGTVLENIEDPSGYYRTIGYWTALFHDHAKQWDQPQNFTRFDWGLTDIVGPDPRWGRWEDSALSTSEFTLLKLAEDKAISVMQKAPRTKDSWGIIHADLRASNIIIDKTGDLTVIDFDDSGFSWYLYDYAAALSFLEHEDCGRVMARQWMAGYQSVHELSEFDIEVASALSMLRKLQLLGWTTDHPEEALPGDLSRDQASGATFCAENYLKDSMWLLN